MPVFAAPLSLEQNIPYTFESHLFDVFMKYICVTVSKCVPHTRLLYTHSHGFIVINFYSVFYILNSNYILLMFIK